MLATCYMKCKFDLFLNLFTKKDSQLWETQMYPDW